MCVCKNVFKCVYKSTFTAKCQKYLLKAKHGLEEEIAHTLAAPSGANV